MSFKNKLRNSMKKRMNFKTFYSMIKSLKKNNDKKTNQIQIFLDEIVRRIIEKRVIKSE